MEREAKITLPPSPIRRRGWQRDVDHYCGIILKSGGMIL